MSWEYDPLTGLFFFISIILGAVFMVLLFYFLYFVNEGRILYNKLKALIEPLKGELSTKLLHDDQKSLLPPRAAWIRAAYHGITVESNLRIVGNQSAGYTRVPNGPV